MAKRIHLNAFEMNCVGHLAHGLWRHPDNNRHRYTDLTYWTELAQLLERGKFDALFLADVVGVYDVYKQGDETALREAVQIPCNDPFFVVPPMALVTKHLGFADVHARPSDEGTGRLEHRHLVLAERGAQLRSGADGAP
jgi:hypothetical protein